MTNCCFLHMFLCTVLCPSKLYMPISLSPSFILPLPPSSSSSSLTVNPTKQAYAFFFSIPHISLSLSCSLPHCLLSLCVSVSGEAVTAHISQKRAIHKRGPVISIIGSEGGGGWLTVVCCIVKIYKKKGCGQKEHRGDKKVKAWGGQDQVNEAPGDELVKRSK